MRSRDRFPWLFLAPLLTLMALVWVAPLIYSLGLAFSDAGPGAAGGFVGLKNFSRALKDVRFAGALRASVVFATGASLLNVGGGLFLAILLRRFAKERAAAQTALLLPWVLSDLAAALIWREIFDENAGWGHLILAQWGIEPLPWRTNGFWAMGSLWIVALWQGLAFSTMLQMAGLASLSDRLIQAAKLDGAGRWMVLRAVIWPHMKRVLAANALLVFLMSMVTFSLPFALTGGGPLFDTELASLYAYRTAFTGRFELGYAAAQGMLVLGAYALLTAVWLRVRRASP